MKIKYEGGKIVMEKINILDKIKDILESLNKDNNYGEGWEEIADSIGKLEEGIIKLKKFEK